MSTPNPEIVNKDNSFAEIQHAINVNASQVEEVKNQVIAEESQQKQAVAAYTASEQSGTSISASSDSSSLVSQTASIGESLSGPKNQHAGVYGNMAMDSVGLAGVSEMVGLLGSAIKGETSFKGMQTLEGMARAGKRDTSGRGRIETDPLSDREALLGRSKASGDFARNAGKPGKWGAMEKIGSQFTSKIQQTCSAQLVSQQQLGNALQAKAQKGAMYAKLAPNLGGGRAMQLVNDLSKGPKGPSEDIACDVKEVVDDGTTSWA